MAIETRAEADLMLGRHGELVGELEALCREHPLRERLWELLMLALYRAGRQAEALRAYTEARDYLVDELGIDPGPALRELEARILAQDPSLAAAGPAGLAGGSGADGNGQPAGAIEQLRRSHRGTRGAERGGPLCPAGDADRSRRGGQDPAGGGGGRRTAPRSTGTGPGWSSSRASPSPTGLRGLWPARSGRPRPASLARLRRTRRWSSSCATWPGGRFWSSSTTVNT